MNAHSKLGVTRLLFVLMLPASTLMTGRVVVAQEQVASQVGWLVLEGDLPDTSPPFNWIDADDQRGTLRGVIRQLDYVAQSPSHLGVIVFLDQANLTLAQVDELTEAIARVRQSDKKVLTFAEVYDTSDYLLACAADAIVLQKKGGLFIPGLGAEEIYLAGLLEKIGVSADFMQVGKFKGAQEPLTRKGPSEFWSQTIDGMLDDLWAQMLARIAEGRSKTEADVEQALSQTLSASDEQLVELGLVDQLAERDLLSVTEEVFGADFEWDRRMGAVSQANPAASNPMALLGKLFAPEPSRISRDSVAVIRAAGPISSSDSTLGDGLFNQDSIGSRTLIRTLGKARDNELIKAVVIRMDSPGGSALASEMIWQAVRDLASEKPVFVSVDGMAASGGYYIACAADQIFVSPSSIVGSIGVVGGKIVLGGLYEKIGVTVHRRSRGLHGDLFNSVEPFTQDQRDALESMMHHIYDQFTDRVTSGRGERIAKLDEVAQGRIFTGRQALANGLADQLGGLEDTVAAVADQAGLEEGAYDVVALPEPMSLGEYLDSLFNASAPNVGAVIRIEAPWLTAARQTLGDQTWRAVGWHVQATMQLQREPVLLLTPAPLIVK